MLFLPLLKYMIILERVENQSSLQYYLRRPFNPLTEPFVHRLLAQRFHLLAEWTGAFLYWLPNRIWVLLFHVIREAREETLILVAVFTGMSLAMARLWNW